MLGKGGKMWLKTSEVKYGENQKIRCEKKKDKV